MALALARLPSRAQQALVADRRHDGFLPWPAGQNLAALAATPDFSLGPYGLWL
jgi:hypothetical protein